MYTWIRDPEGKVTLRTHVDPSRLSPEDARRLLRRMRPLLEALESATREEERPDDDPSPRPRVRRPSWDAPDS